MHRSRRIVVITAAGFALASVLSACAAWPAYRFGPDRNADNPAETRIVARSVARAELAWRLPATPADPIGIPLVSAGTMYLNRAVIDAQGRYSSGTQARFVSTGALRWSRGYPQSVTSMVVSGSALFMILVHENTVSVAAASTSDGRLLWQRTVPQVDPWDDTPEGTVTMADGRVVVTRGEQGVFAYNTGGRLLWQRDLCDGTRAGCQASASGGPAYQNNRLYLPGVVLSAASGKTAWTYGSGSVRMAVSSRPVVAGTTMYVAGGALRAGSPFALTGGLLAAYPAAGCGRATCLPRWIAHAPIPLRGDPVIAHGEVVAPAGPTNATKPEPIAYAFNSATGGLDWTGPNSSGITLVATAAGDVAYVTDLEAASVYALDVKGCGGQAVCPALATFRPNLDRDSPLSEAIVTDGTLLIASPSHGLYAYQLAG
jgi:outer membrane protein assembly factor BamB